MPLSLPACTFIALLALFVLLLSPAVAQARIVVDQSDYVLNVLHGDKVVKQFPVAVGMPAFPTPNGHFKIVAKVANPSWKAPNSSWVPAPLRGKTLRGAASPLQGYWFTLSAPSSPPGSIGIHGTSAPETMGSRASHGCVRLRPADAVRLAGMVRVGERVLIEP